jgi:hypothetical protein
VDQTHTNALRNKIKSHQASTNNGGAYIIKKPCIISLYERLVCHYPLPIIEELVHSTALAPKQLLNYHDLTFL